jgi:hydroxyacylglutathione hydrolase
MVGCQRSGEALVIDPGRDVEPYIQAASAEGLRIVAVAETHIHADFVAGSRELAERLGAKLYLSDEGPAEWKYQYADKYSSHLLKDGDNFKIGNVQLEVMHTPGHTPESISFVLTDVGGGADAPMGIFTGDFVFVGSIGRPDLLETAAGVVGSADSGARQLFSSMLKFRGLPDHLQVWPAHGAGSACGKGLGAIPSSTVGYEKRFNPALQFTEEQLFVDYILSDQPETPAYFANMKRVNKVGPTLIAELPAVQEIATERLPSIVQNSTVVDVGGSDEFANAHVPGTINLPQPTLVQWAGFLVDYDAPVYVLGDPSKLSELLRQLRSIGIDRVAGLFDWQAAKQAGLRTQSYAEEPAAELRERIEAEQVTLIDVRARTEFETGHIPHAEHYFLGNLVNRLTELPTDRPIVTQCLSGGRSAIAAGILQRAGLNVINLQGGIRGWSQAGFPVVRAQSGVEV